MIDFNKSLGKTMMIGILVGVIILASIHYYAIRSYIIMLPYSYYHSQLSGQKQNDYLFYMPSNRRSFGDGWYPKMLIFHDDKGFEKWVDRPVELTVYYRFGGFPFGSNHSTYFDRSSNRFSSFYGAYNVRNKNQSTTIYGYNEDEEIVLSDIMRITEYDQRWLVMPSIGLSPEDVVFEVEIIDIHDAVDFKPASGLKWTKVDAYFSTNSPEHHYQEKHRGYLQYGLPLEPPEGVDDYSPITLAGRIYVAKTESNNSLIAFYALAVNFEIVDEIDNEILSKTRMNIR